MAEKPRLNTICNFSQFLRQHHILPYLLAIIPSQFHSIGSEFTINYIENDKLFVKFKKFIINEALFDQSLHEYLWY